LFTKLTYFTPVLGAAAVAAAIFAAPIASAATAESCGGTGGETVCQTPGNVQLNADPSSVQFYPYGGEGFLLGGNGFGGGGFGGGFHGAGFGGGSHGGHR
jgi:uncharacterized membrane protein